MQINTDQGQARDYGGVGAGPGGGVGALEKLWMNLQATWDLDVAVKRRVVV